MQPKCVDCQVLVQALRLRLLEDHRVHHAITRTGRVQSAPDPRIVGLLTTLPTGDCLPARISGLFMCCLRQGRFRSSQSSGNVVGRH